MKKIYLTFLIAAFASATWAQDTPKKPSFTGFVSNGFWDNWEISVGAGAGTAFSNGSNLKSFGDLRGDIGAFEELLQQVAHQHRFGPSHDSGVLDSAAVRSCVTVPSATEKRA